MVRKDEALAAVMSWPHGTFYWVATVAETPLCCPLQNPVVLAGTKVLKEGNPRAVAIPLNLKFKVRHLAQSLDEMWQVLFPCVSFSSVLIFNEVFKRLFIADQAS